MRVLYYIFARIGWMAKVKADKRKLNKEQLEAVKHKKGPLLIIAGAGTGKTTVITERIKYLILSKLAKPSEILALTFTEKAAREMEERVDVAMPYGYTQMWISTFHSFCDRILRAEALHIGFDPKYKLMAEAETVQFIRNNLFKFNLKYFRPLGNPTKFVGGMLQHFSRLQDEDIAPREYLKYAEKLVKKKKKNKEEKIEADKTIELAKAFKTYDELKVKEGLMDFGDLIVKTLILFRRRPNILGQYQKQFKHVLVDEFQDTNYAQNELAILLASRNKNITVTGDDDQCLPPDAEIATATGLRKIKNIRKGDKVITAVGKGHTSISKVTKVFKRKKKTRLLTFKTEDGGQITVTDNHKMFCFTPAHYKPHGWHFVYLMHQQGLGWRLGVTNSVPQRLKLERRADRILAIGSYKTDQEARFYESYYAAKYGLPTVPFSARPKQAVSGKWLSRLFEELDTERGARSLARDLNLELDSPQFLVDGVTRGTSRRVKVNLIMCHRNYRSKTHKDGFVGNPSVSHVVQVETSDVKALHALKKAGFRLNKAKKGKRFRLQTTSLKKAWGIAEELVEITDGIMDKKFKVGRYNYQHLPARIVPASHVLPGMYLPALKGKQIVYKKVVSRKGEKRQLKTYDLEIERTHNFIADGVVVHNSIYRFRGAAVSNIIQFRKTYPRAKIVVLTKNYRSTQEILDRAYDLIQHNNPDRLEAVEKIDKKLITQRKQSKGEIEFIHEDRVENEADRVAKKVRELTGKKGFDFKDVAILVRANNHAEPFIRALSRYGIPYQFLGPGRLFKQSEVVDLISYLKLLYDFEDSVALYRLLSIDHFGIKSRDLVKIGNYARRLNKSLYEACEKVDDIFVSSETRRKIKKFIGIVERHLKLIKKETAGQLLYYFLEDTGLLTKLLNPDSPEAERKASNISKFFDKLKTYEVEHEDATVPAVVDWIELSSELGESPRAADTDWTEINAVNILTTHSAKGLEFPIVFLVNLVSQRFPTIERREQIPIPEELIKEVLPVGDYHLQEERRLFYVGMTRARDRLLFTAANYYGEGKREKRLSPFIFEALGDSAVSAERPLSSQQLSFLDYAPSDVPMTLAPTRYPLTIHIDYLSYSQIETFRICPLHYKLKYILKIPTPPSAAQSFGISVHAALKDFYLHIKSGKRLSEKLIFQALEENWTVEGYASKAHERRMLERGRNYLLEFYKKEFNPKKIPVTLEQPFVVPLGLPRGERRLKIGGKIDRVDKLAKGMIEVIDYKTGANVPTQKQIDHDLQLTFYALAATGISEEPFNKKPENIKLSLYYFDDQKKISTARTKKQLEEAKREILKWREEIEKSDFKCSGHFFCENCEYSLMCRAGRG